MPRERGNVGYSSPWELPPVGEGDLNKLVDLYLTIDKQIRELQALNPDWEDTGDLFQMAWQGMRDYATGGPEDYKYGWQADQDNFLKRDLALADLRRKKQELERSFPFLALKQAQASDWDKFIVADAKKKLQMGVPMADVARQTEKARGILASTVPTSSFTVEDQLGTSPPPSSRQAMLEYAANTTGIPMNVLMSVEPEAQDKIFYNLGLGIDVPGRAEAQQNPYMQRYEAAREWMSDPQFKSFMSNESGHQPKGIDWLINMSQQMSQNKTARDLTRAQIDAIRSDMEMTASEQKQQQAQFEAELAQRAAYYGQLQQQFEAEMAWQQQQATMQQQAQQQQLAQQMAMFQQEQELQRQLAEQQRQQRMRELGASIGQHLNAMESQNWAQGLPYALPIGTETPPGFEMGGPVNMLWSMAGAPSYSPMQIGPSPAPGMGQMREVIQRAIERFGK